MAKGAPWAFEIAIRRSRLIVALFVFTAACQSQSGDDGWIELFNGENMDDWTVKVRGYLAGENFANTFRVEDGLLTVGYDEYDSDYNDRFGHIFHKTPFSHYRLLVEYRFVGEQAQNAPGWATRNSGVMLHSQDPYTMPPGQDFPISIEVQFLGGITEGIDRPTANMCSPGTHIEYRGAFNDTHCEEPVKVAVRPGMVGWDQPDARVHRGVNSGATMYEEVVTFFLDEPRIDPQPEQS
jgi:hypothetical protein